MTYDEALAHCDYDVSLVTDEGGAAHVIHDPNQLAILEEQHEHERRVLNDAGLVTTDDAKSIELIVNQIEETPTAFAIRHLALERAHALLADAVQDLQREVRRLSYWAS